MKGDWPMKNMKNTIIRTYGFEHPATLYFFECCEKFPTDEMNIRIAYDFAMNWPTEEDE